MRDHFLHEGKAHENVSDVMLPHDIMPSGVNDFDSYYTIFRLKTLDCYSPILEKFV